MACDLRLRLGMFGEDRAQSRDDFGLVGGEVFGLRRVGLVVVQFEHGGVRAAPGVFHSTSRWRAVRMARPIVRRRGDRRG